MSEAMGARISARMTTAVSATAGASARRSLLSRRAMRRAAEREKREETMRASATMTNCTSERPAATSKLSRLVRAHISDSKVDTPPRVITIP